MKPAEHNKIRALIFAVWEMFDHFFHRFDPEKIKDVVKIPHHKWWVNLTEFILKPLMYVPGEGLNLVKVHSVGATPGMSFENLFCGGHVCAGDFKLTEHKFFPDVTDHEVSNRILEFSPESGEYVEKFLKKFLGTSADRSQLPKSLIGGFHLMSVASVDEVLLHPRTFGIQLNQGDWAAFFVRGIGETVEVVFVECTGGSARLLRHGSSIYELPFRSVNRIFIADPKKTIPDPTPAS